MIVATEEQTDELQDKDFYSDVTAHYFLHKRYYYGQK